MENKDNKVVWVVSSTGCLKDEGWRPHRYNYLVEALLKENYTVVWWLATFSHHSKTLRFKRDTTIKVSPNYEQIFLNAGSYTKHISLDRFLFILRFSLKFYLKGKKTGQHPSALILAMPPPGLELAGYLLSKRFHAKLIVDFIDTWPEFFICFFPKILRPIAEILFLPLKSLRNFICNNSAGIVSCCKTYLNLPGMNQKNHVPTECVFWGSDPVILDNERETSKRIQIEYGLTKNAGDTWFVYGGTLGNNYDILTILRTAKKLRSYTNIKLIIAGNGPFKNLIVDFIDENELKNVTYIGQVDSWKLQQIFALSDVGISAYINGSTVAMPIKFYDYIAAGLALVNSLEGELDEFISTNNVGLQYQSEDSDSLAAAMLSLADDLDSLGVMKANAKNLAIEFQFDKQYGKYAKFVSNILARKLNET
jgi:glycosyltransferase involved in cell wall biosynthesis